MFSGNPIGFCTFGWNHYYNRFFSDNWICICITMITDGILTSQCSCSMYIIMYIECTYTKYRIGSYVFFRISPEIVYLTIHNLGVSLTIRQNVLFHYNFTQHIRGMSFQQQWWGSRRLAWLGWRHEASLVGRTSGSAGSRPTSDRLPHCGGAPRLMLLFFRNFKCNFISLWC